LVPTADIFSFSTPPPGPAAKTGLSESIIF
jgi:hypothetical protein